MSYKVVYGFDALADEMGLKPKRKVQKDWAKPKQEKFLQCPICGGAMTRHEGTNVLQCENAVEDKRSDGENEKRVCGYIRLLDEKSVNYGEYIFSNGDFTK